MYPRRNPDVKTTLLPDGHVVLFGTATDWAQTLNPTAALIWEFCDGEHSLDDIASELDKLLPQSGKVDLESEIRQFVDSLVESGLVTSES